MNKLTFYEGMMSKIVWSNELLDELYLEKTQNGKSLTDLSDLMFTKYGVRFTQGRLSQVLKAYREQFNNEDKIADENRNNQE